MEDNQFAYVKFLSGPMNGKKIIISITKINNFKKEIHKNNLKYKINYNNHECVGIILFQAATKKDIEDIIKKNRITTIPERLLVSASSDNDTENGDKENKIQNMQNNNETKLSHSLHVQKRLQIKLEKFDYIAESDKLENSKNSITEIQDKSPLDSINDEKDINQNQINQEKDKSVIKIISDEFVAKKIDTTKYKSSVIASESDELKSLKRKLKELKYENEKANKKKKELKKFIENKDIQIQQLSDLNKKLQTELIGKFQEQKDEIAKLINCNNKGLTNNENNGNYDENFPTFLRTRTTDNIRRVHIGNDVWITERAFNKINLKTCSARQLAGNILLSVFEENVLLKSTISGHETNKKAAAGQKKITRKLDEKRVCACEKLYEHLLLKNFHKFKPTKKVYGKTVQVILEAEQRMFKHYAQKKIAELKSNIEKSCKMEEIDKITNKANENNEENFNDIDINYIQEKNEATYDRSAPTTSLGKHAQKKIGKQKSNIENSSKMEEIIMIDNAINKANNEKNDENSNDLDINDSEENSEEIYDWSPPANSPGEAST